MYSKPVISVIVPAYNEHRLIGDTILALKAQRFPHPYEIIIVDNNSTDATAGIARRLGVRVVTQKQKGYAYAAREGIAHARGHIIAMTDADTAVPPDWLARIYETFESHPHVVAAGGPYEFEEGPRALRIILHAINRINPQLITTSLCGMNMAFRRAAYEEVGGFSSHINLQADTYLGEQIKKIGKIHFIRDNTVLSSARRFQKPKQLIAELSIRIANALMLKFFSTTLYKKQIDYR